MTSFLLLLLLLLLLRIVDCFSDWCVGLLSNGMWWELVVVVVVVVVVDPRFVYLSIVVQDFLFHE